MIKVNGFKCMHFITAIIMSLSFVTMFYGCKTPEVKKGKLQMCDTDIKSKCSGTCIDGTEPRYYFDHRKISFVEDEADNRVKFLKKQNLGDLDDYPEILHGEKKNASFAKYSPPECDGCKPKFQLNGADVKCEDFYMGIEKLNADCSGCVEVLPEKLKK